MSIQMFDSESSDDSYCSLQLKKLRVCGDCDSSTSIQLFDSESSIGSPQLKKQRINGFNNCDSSQKNFEIDENGHIVCCPGLIINGKYKILCTLGEGKFGRVVEVQNVHTNKILAIKTIRNVEGYRNVAKQEIEVLEVISKADPQDTSLCIKMLEWFDYHGHICIVFEALGLSLHQFLAKNHFQPFPLDQVRHIGHQLCKSVDFLHRNGITHTDLKPDNILFVDTNRTSENSTFRGVRRTDVRLIDFGNAVMDQQLRKVNITTRFYRAPEVILQLGWDQSSDVWSLGCILFELYIGEMLFIIPDNPYHHLAVMEKILGKFPEQIMFESKKKYFIDGKVNFDWSDVIVEMINYYKPLNEYLLSQSEDDIALFDLITKMLVCEPSKRISLDQALKHSFFEKI